MLIAKQKKKILKADHRMAPNVILLLLLFVKEYETETSLLLVCYLLSDDIFMHTG